jgi:hypothetical protein
METKINWKKSLFSNNYQLFLNDQEVAFLETKFWSQKGIGKYGSLNIEFKVKGFFRQMIQIIDLNNQGLIGEIELNNWKTKALIRLNNSETFDWEFTNFWNTKFKLTGYKNIDIFYHGSSRKGIITSNSMNEILILAGLYIAHHFWQRNTAMVAT